MSRAEGADSDGDCVGAVAGEGVPPDAPAPDAALSSAPVVGFEAAAGVTDVFWLPEEAAEEECFLRL